MRFSRSFALGLGWRVALTVACGLALAALLADGGYRAPVIVAAAAVVGSAAELWRFVQQTNVAVARFVEAVTFGDLAQRFSHARPGGGFDELGDALDGAMRRLRDERAAAADDSQFYAALVDAAPTPLVTIDPVGRVELANTAARRLFGPDVGVRVDHFVRYGAELAAALAEMRPGGRRLTRLLIDGTLQRAMLTVSRLRRLGGEVRVVAVQPIQLELNAIEMTAQTDLVRVLTHEIMNSITPVTSLARTAAGLLARVDDGVRGDVTDARVAVDTLARRADGLLRFVESYRQISRAPPVRRQRFAAARWAGELVRLLRTDWPAERLELVWEVTPDTLEIDADPDLLAQVVINLLRNGAEAATGWMRFTIELTEGGRTRIEIDDDGPGVPEPLRDEVFLPFFTTKPAGTGVGLSLARQIVLAHGGMISVEPGERGGARFRVTL